MVEWTVTGIGTHWQNKTPGDQIWFKEEESQEEEEARGENK